MSEQRPLHRLFDLSWMDLCRGSSLEVREEVDLSHKQQFLDLTLVRQGSGPLPRLPDGFEQLATHNLVTFKSHQETLDRRALWELVGHLVNYTKQVSPSVDQLLPESDFRCFAVCVRWPHNLAQEVELKLVRPGVYDVLGFGLTIRVIVIHQLPQAEQNAMLLLFSAREEALRYARDHYRPRSKETSTLLYELFLAYEEDPEMSQKLEEFVRQSIDDLLAKLPPEKRLEGLSPEERLEGLSPEERLEGLSADELRQTLEAIQKRLNGNGQSSRPG